MDAVDARSPTDDLPTRCPGAIWKEKTMSIVERAVFLLILVLAVAACSKTPAERLAIHKAKGKAYLEEGKIDEAILELQNALSIARDDPEALAGLGDALLQRGDVSRAHGALLRASELAPDNPLPHLQLGNLYLLANSLDEAKYRAERVLEIAPDRADARVLLGKAFLREGRTGEALAHFEEAVRREPDNPEPRMVKATALVTMGRLEDARRTLEEILTREAPPLFALLLLAQVADLQGDAETADRTFDRLLRSRAKDAEVWLAYGNFWLAKGDLEKAAKAYEQASERDRKGTAGLERIGEVALARGDVRTAEQAVAAILKRNSQSDAAKVLRSRLLIGEGKFGEASSDLRPVVTAQPNHPTAHYFLGLAEYRLGNLQQARAALQKAVEVAPEFLPAATLLALVHVDRREYEAALEVTRQGAARRTATAELAVVRAAALMGLGRIPEARTLLEQVVEVAPGYARAYEELGRCHLLLGDADKALEAFAAALERDSRNTRPLVYSVNALVLRKRWDAAVSLVNQHARAHGDQASFRMLVAEVLRAKGDREGVRREAERAIALDPQMAEPYLLLAQLHPWPQGVRAAVADLDRALEKDRRSVTAWMLKGVLHGMLGETEEAGRAYRRVLDLQPNFAPALNDLAWLLATEEGRVDEALGLASRAVEINPGSAAFNDTLGWIYVQKGVFLKALSHLEPAARQLPENPQVHYHLGKAYAGLQQKDKAIASLKRALELSDRFPGSEDARKTVEELKTSL